MLGLSPTRKCILFGADPSNIKSKRKGGDLLRNTLEQLGDLARESDILQFGGVRQQTKIGLFDCFHLGSYTDDLSLSVIYSAADCFVAPSRQDNLPNTVIESLACGTPIVAFKIGGMPDMIDSTVGRLARPFDTMDLAESIRSVLLPNNYDFGSACRRRAVQEFSQREISDAYRKLYLQILDSTFPK
jgi:glycosyltransferase involved in cell wall biosynthesis